MDEKSDFYSEDVPPPKDEEEILEFEPIESTDEVVSASKTVGEENERGNTENNDNSDANNIQIDSTEVATIESREAFEQELVRNLDQVDFSRNRGYNVDTVGSTRSQIISKIRSELLELELGSQNDENTEEDDKEILRTLKSRLKKISLGESRFVREWRKEIQKYDSGLLFDQKEYEIPEGEEEENSSTASYSMISEGDLLKKKEQVETRLLDIENRLKGMEELIGGSIDPSDINATEQLTVQDEIDDLYRRMNLILNSEQLTNDIQARFNKASENLEKYKESSRRIDNAKLEAFVPVSDMRVSSIFNQLQRLEAHENVIPLITRRLQAINNIVSEASDTISFMKNLNGELAKTKMEVKKWNAKLDSMVKRSETRQQAWNKDKDSIKRWIHNLEEKMKVL